jgi:hypothetical protein
LPTAILDSYQSQGSDGFVLDAPHIHAGAPAYAGGFRMTHLLGGVYHRSPRCDIGDHLRSASITPSASSTIGYSADNLLDAELIIMTCSNWSYTIPDAATTSSPRRATRAPKSCSIAPDVNPTSPACRHARPGRRRTATPPSGWGLPGHCQLRRSTDRDFVL